MEESTKRNCFRYFEYFKDWQFKGRPRTPQEDRMNIVEENYIHELLYDEVPLCRNKGEWWCFQIPTMNISQLIA